MKAMRGKRLTSREAARALGVSEASVKRWADGGLLPSEKTAGGHRRFRPEDLAALRRAGLARGESDALKKRAAALHARPAQVSQLDPAREAALVAETFRVLTDARDEELSAMLVNLHLHGLSVAQIADRFVCPAMRRVGELWHSGELSVAQEHIATHTTATALRGLEEATRSTGESKALALCCSVEEDFHELPVRLASLALAEGGFDIFDVGVSTPFSALTEMVERFRPALVCVSATVLLSLDRASRECAEFTKTAGRRGARVVLGGAGFAPPEVRARLPADLHAESFRQLEDFAASLDAVGP